MAPRSARSTWVPGRFARSTAISASAQERWAHLDALFIARRGALSPDGSVRPHPPARRGRRHGGPVPRVRDGPSGALIAESNGSCRRLRSARQQAGATRLLAVRPDAVGLGPTEAGQGQAAGPGDVLAHQRFGLVAVAVAQSVKDRA